MLTRLSNKKTPTLIMLAAVLSLTACGSKSDGDTVSTPDPIANNVDSESESEEENNTDGTENEGVDENTDNSDNNDFPYSVYINPSFETAGVIVSDGGDTGGALHALADNIQIELKRHTDQPFIAAHAFTRYDQHNVATSLFNLQPGTNYQIRITTNDEQATYSFVTKSFSLPSQYDHDVLVNDNTSLQSELANVDEQQSTRIRLAPGEYNNIAITEKNFGSDKPLVIQSQNSNDKAILKGGEAVVQIDRSSNIIIDGLDITQGQGKGVAITTSKAIVLQNNYIHDIAGRYGVLVKNSSSFDDGVGGHMLFDSNVIEGLGGSFREESNSEGINIQQDGGPMNVIRNNIFREHYDNIKPCADEDTIARNLHDNTIHALNLTGDGHHNNYGLDIYNNEFDLAGDDNVELDGSCVNVRLYNNTLTRSQNSITIAPVNPGPFFILRNKVSNWREGPVKMNTGGEGSAISTRNVYIYHNSFLHNNSDSSYLLRMQYGDGGSYFPVRNINFVNNIFTSEADPTIRTESSNIPNFSHNLWDSNGDLTVAQTLDNDGIFADANVNTDLSLNENSPAIDAATLINGVNNEFFQGTAADVGAEERSE